MGSPPACRRVLGCPHQHLGAGRVRPDGPRPGCGSERGGPSHHCRAWVRAQAGDPAAGQPTPSARHSLTCTPDSQSQAAKSEVEARPGSTSAGSRCKAREAGAGLWPAGRSPHRASHPGAPEAGQQPRALRKALRPRWHKCIKKKLHWLVDWSWILTQQCSGCFGSAPRNRPLQVGRLHGVLGMQPGPSWLGHLKGKCLTVVLSYLSAPPPFFNLYD